MFIEYLLSHDVYNINNIIINYIHLIYLYCKYINQFELINFIVFFLVSC